MLPQQGWRNVATAGMEKSMLGITMMEKKNYKWIGEQTKSDDVMKDNKL